MCGYKAMTGKRKKLLGVLLLFTVTVILFVMCIREHTVIYYVGTEEEPYTREYLLPFFVKSITVKPPQTEAENLLFQGWYYEEELINPVEGRLQLSTEGDQGITEIYASWFQDDPDTDYTLPELFITSGEGYADVERGEYLTCSYRMTNTNFRYCFDGLPGEVRGRGNSTWTEFEKKPYKIKFSERQDIFGMGDDKEWALLSNTMDHAMLRNEIAFGIADIMGLSYTSDCQLCHLYWNEEYLGVYLLCETVETGINRVNIETDYDPEEIMVSFFVEMGGGVNGFPLSPVEGSDRNWEENFSVAILYPEEEVITKHQEEYMDAYMQLVNNAIFAKNWQSITDLVDVDSFAGWYLTNEIMLNGDMGWSMFGYMPKGGKLYLGPVWDFDQSCGSSETGGEAVDTWQPDTSSQNLWFDTLMEMEEFRAVIASKWKENKEALELFLTAEEEKAKHLSGDMDANFDRWHVLGVEEQWRMREEIAEFTTYEEHVSYLFAWLRRRIHWLDSEIST